MTNEELLDAAKHAREYSYSPYSKFRVGAALLTKEGEVFTGCNIENSSYGATICAERTAIFKAMSEGKRNFVKIAIVGENGKPAFPCGMCRQVMTEVMPENASIILEDTGKIIEYSLKELFPHMFLL